MKPMILAALFSLSPLIGAAQSAEDIAEAAARLNAALEAQSTGLAEDYARWHAPGRA